MIVLVVIPIIVPELFDAAFVQLTSSDLLTVRRAVRQEAREEWIMEAVHAGIIIVYTFHI